MDTDDKTWSRYLKVDLLIIDDMGMKRLPSHSGECLFEVILRRHDLRSTMMTSNRPLEDWGKLLGDVPSATAILDRFLEHAELLVMKGRSYRLGRRPEAYAKGEQEAAIGDCEEAKTDTSAHRVEEANSNSANATKDGETPKSVQEGSTQVTIDESSDQDQSIDS